jgi:phosphoribosyl 1,2-cyclic phosphodiesterase
MSAGWGLVCLGSSSAGNGYVITAGEDRLIVELGLKWDSYLKALDYDLDGISGVLVTHSHRRRPFNEYQ